MNYVEHLTVERVRQGYTWPPDSILIIVMIIY